MHFIHPGEEAVFMPLYTEARKLLTAHPDAQQAIVLQSASQKIYTVVSSHICQGDHTEENACLQRLQQNGNAQLLRLVALWQDGGTDVPSYAFRQALVALDPGNRQTQILMLSERGYHAMVLGATLPRASAKQLL